MSRQVRAALSGQGLSQAELEQFSSIALALQGACTDVRTLSKSWGQLSGYLMQKHAVISQTPCRLLGNGSVSGHANIAFAAIASSVDNYSQTFKQLGDHMENLAANLIRTYSLYSQAEDRLTSLLSRVTQGAFNTAPLFFGLVATGVGTAHAIFDNLKDGKGVGLDPYDIARHTKGIHESFMEGLANNLYSNKRLIALLAPNGELDVDHSVNAFSGKLSVLSSRLAHQARGNHLSVTQAQPTGNFLSSSHTIDQALSNLHRLGSCEQGISYATVAVQKYRHLDGSVGWIVTIPGTNDHPDSPMGWEQNLELMSNNKQQRMQAASARFVHEAMQQAGIKPQDSVALVGHSQGGIVAATIASDLSENYRIEHVVTAGSPIANHPIPRRTWVTSVEMDDEIVANLDGAKNPKRDNWLTVTGSTLPIPSSMPVAGHTPVADARESRELSHGMNYQRAAWQNAVSQGRPAQRRHDDHFASISEGSLDETNYYQGRLHHQQDEISSKKTPKQH